MDSNDLRTDIDLECPHCNRKFQQAEDAEDSGDADCPECGEPLVAAELGDDKKE